MAESPPAAIEPPVLRWARESIGYTQEEAAEKIDMSLARLAAAEAGEAQITLRQAERAARLYDRPIAALFVREPPSEQPTEALFRRLPGAPPPPWPPEMRRLVRRIRTQQEAAASILRAIGDEPTWSPPTSTGQPVDSAAEARDVLGVTLEAQRSWRDPSGYTPLRKWTVAVERLGALVVQDGSVPLDLMRGFASLHAEVPAIVIHNEDDPRARAFTVIHELGHLIRGPVAVDSRADVEAWCEEFAGNVLMPEEGFAEDFETVMGDAQGLDQLRALARLYGVTRLAAAVRASRLGLGGGRLGPLIGTLRARGPAEESKPTGGNYYWNTVGRLSPSYITLVFDALDTEAISHVEASGLLGVKINNFGPLRERALRRLQGAE